MDDCPSTPRVRSGVTCWRRSGKPTERVYGDEQLDRLARRVLADSAGIPLLVVALLHAVAAGFEPSDDELEWQGWLAAEPRGYAFVARIVRDVIDRDMVTAGHRQRIRRAVDETA